MIYTMCKFWQAPNGGLRKIACMHIKKSCINFMSFLCTYMRVSSRILRCICTHINAPSLKKNMTQFFCAPFWWSPVVWVVWILSGVEPLSFVGSDGLSETRMEGVDKDVMCFDLPALSLLSTSFADVVLKVSLLMFVSGSGTQLLLWQC